MREEKLLTPKELAELLDYFAAGGENVVYVRHGHGGDARATQRGING